MKSRLAKLAIALGVMTSPLYAQTAPAAPIPVQISAAKAVFLSNAGDADSVTLNLDYKAVYTALQGWGRYRLTDTPAEADLIFELHYDHILSNCSVISGNGGCDEADVLTLHIVDRATHVTLWPVSVIGSGKNEKEALRAAGDIVATLKTLTQPNASTNGTSAPVTRAGLSEGNK